MGVTSYYSFGGEILGEETGGVRRDYLTDALGSVTATVTETGVVENTYRYKPYGDQLTKTGTGSDPKFLWVGTWGYKISNALIYVRTRNYSYLYNMWINKDKYKVDFKNINYYLYDNVVNNNDYWGNGNRSTEKDFACRNGVPYVSNGSNYIAIPKDAPFYSCMVKVCKASFAISTQMDEWKEILSGGPGGYIPICTLVNTILPPVDPGKECYQKYRPPVYPGGFFGNIGAYFGNIGPQGDFCSDNEKNTHCGDLFNGLTGGFSGCCQEADIRVCQYNHDCQKKQLWPKVKEGLNICYSVPVGKRPRNFTLPFPVCPGLGYQPGERWGRIQRRLGEIIDWPENYFVY
jgi:hypothetical protein